MTRINALFILLLLTTLHLQAQPPQKINKNDRASYFKEVCRLIKKNFYYIQQTDFKHYVKTYEPLFLKAPDIDSGYTILKKMLQGLEGHHCGFITPRELLYYSEPATPDLPSGKMLQGNIAFVRVPHCFLAREKVQDYVDSMHQVIRMLETKNPIGWVLDLRENNGGSSNAILAALSPFFYDGDIYYTYDRDQQKTTSRIERGLYKQTRDSKVVYYFSPRRPFQLENRDRPVAVLTSAHTGSAGEIVAIALKALPYTQSFGQATGGVPTGNIAFPLKDGALLYITRSIIADLKGHFFDGPIPPDTNIPADPEASVTTCAISWILQYVNAAGEEPKL